MDIKRTGVFATEEETAECLKLAERARTTPLIAFSSEHALKHGGLSGDAWEITHKTIHKYALAHGLPEIEGYYGLDGSNREFIKT